MELEPSNNRRILLSQRQKLSRVQIMQSHVRKVSERSSQSQKSMPQFEIRNLKFETQHSVSKTASSNEIKAHSNDYISQMQNLLSLYGKNLKEVGRFIELNQEMAHEQTKSQPKNEMVKFEHRKSIASRTMGRPESLPSLQLNTSARRTSISSRFDHASIMRNPYKFELIYDGKHVMVTNFEMNMKTNAYTLPDFFDRLEFFYNKFCESFDKDTSGITESFKALLDFDKIPNSELIERVFFVSKKNIRRSISKQFLMSVMSQLQDPSPQKNVFGRFNRSQKDRVTFASKMFFPENSKNVEKKSNSGLEYARKVSMFDYESQPRSQFAPRNSNASIKQTELSSPLNNELEFLRAMYHVLKTLLKHFFKTKFRNIQRLSQASNEADVKLQQQSHLNIGFNPFLDSEQVSRFAKQRLAVEKMQSENIRDLKRSSIAKCLTKHKYLSQENAFTYLKGIRKFMEKA